MSSPLHCVTVSQWQSRLMLRTLLAERLKLRMHTEKRELSYLALIPAKSSPKMPAAKADAPPNTGPQRPGRLSHNAMGMDLLALLLSRFTGETVIDRTDLGGTWEVQLEWAPEAVRPPGAAIEAVDLPDGPSLYSAIQNQLGLRLIPRKGPMDVWIVDTADRTPAEN